MIVFTRSKSTGGFCATSQRLLSSSKLEHILSDLPELTGRHSGGTSRFTPYKGRSYARLPLSKEGTVQLTQHALMSLGLMADDRLVSIRSSNIAFTMGAKGPLIEKGLSYPGLIEVF